MAPPNRLQLTLLTPEALAEKTYEELEIVAVEIAQLRRDLVAYTRRVVAAMDEHLTARNLIGKLARHHSERELAALDLPNDIVEKVRRVKAERGNRPTTVVGL